MADSDFQIRSALSRMLENTTDSDKVKHSPDRKKSKKKTVRDDGQQAMVDAIAEHTNNTMDQTFKKQGKKKQS